MSPGGTPAMAEPLRQQQRPIRHANTPVRAWCHAHIDAPRHCRTPMGETMPNRKGRLPSGRRYHIPQPIFSEGGTANLQISFGLVNDGSLTVNPKIGSSHLLINGAEPRGWGPIVINNGIRALEFTALPPGHSLRFGYVLGRYFHKPVVYTVGWRGENFRAQSITSPVLPGTR